VTVRGRGGQEGFGEGIGIQGPFFEGRHLFARLAPKFLINFVSRNLGALPNVKLAWAAARGVSGEGDVAGVVVTSPPPLKIEIPLFGIDVQNRFRSILRNPGRHVPQ